MHKRTEGVSPAADHLMPFKFTPNSATVLLKPCTKKGFSNYTVMHKEAS